MSVSPKRVPGTSRWTVSINGGREDAGLDLIEFLKDMQMRGAGEILLNSVDRDGRKSGYDLELLRAAGEILTIPLIASSGAGSMDDFCDGLTVPGVDAVLAASVFHGGDIPILDLKRFLTDRGFSIRLTS